jgi:asparagine synthase (glutamine-hydrolysing)
MAAALELRAPLLSRELVTIGLQAPLEELMPGGERKGFLRSVASRHAPDRLLDRPKMGFALPIGNFFRDERHPLRVALEDLLASRDPFPSATLGFEVSVGAAARMVREHAAGERDHSQRLFMLLVLGIWCGMFA